MNLNVLISLIEEAFENVELGDGIGLSEAQAIDDYMTEDIIKEARKNDETRVWRNLDAGMLDRYYSSPSFFDDKGMRFHIPAYMIADLMGLLKTADPVFFLWHGLTTDESVQDSESIKWRDYAKDRFKLLNSAQRRAVREYLMFRLAGNHINAAEIELAIKNYWKMDNPGEKV